MAGRIAKEIAKAVIVEINAHVPFVHLQQDGVLANNLAEVAQQALLKGKERAKAVVSAAIDKAVEEA